jgi:hypothetical protein
LYANNNNYSPPLPLLIGPDPAIITVSHMDPIDAGTDIQLNCSATLRPPITYSWMFDSASLPSDSRFQENPSQGYLRISMVTPDIGGVYVCTVRNADGTVTSSDPAYTLTVREVERK